MLSQAILYARQEAEDGEVQIKAPQASDGYRVHELIKVTPPLDTNSVYCNLLQCDHFASTSAMAVTDADEIVGFVSGYIIPNKPDTLFVWQVSVAEIARGKNLGVRMMQDILNRNTCVNFIETTITKSNDASQHMFGKLALILDSAPVKKALQFEKTKHFAGLHESEYLYRIGPFQVDPEQELA